MRPKNSFITNIDIKAKYVGVFITHHLPKSAWFHVHINKFSFVSKMHFVPVVTNTFNPFISFGM